MMRGRGLDAAHQLRMHELDRRGRRSSRGGAAPCLQMWPCRSPITSLLMTSSSKKSGAVQLPFLLDLVISKDVLGNGTGHTYSHGAACAGRISAHAHTSSMVLTRVSAALGSSSISSRHVQVQL